MSGMNCGGGAAGGIPTRPGGSFAASGVLVGKDANYDGVIEKNEMGFIPTGGVIAGGGAPGPMPVPYAGGAAGGMATGGVTVSGGMAGGVAYGSGGGGAGYGGVQYGGGHAGGVPAPGGPGGAFAASGVLVGKDANYDGMIERNEMGFIATGGAIGGGGGAIDDGNCEDCVRTVTTYKTVQVPCTRNRYKVVNYTVPKTVPYTDYETVTKTRTVVKQVPKTIFVPVKTEEPYQDRVPVTKYKTIQINKQRTECEPHTRIVTRKIPVVNVVPNPPPPCPPQPCDDGVTPLPQPMPQPRY